MAVVTAAGCLALPRNCCWSCGQQLLLLFRLPLVLQRCVPHGPQRPTGGYCNQPPAWELHAMPLLFNVVQLGSILLSIAKAPRGSGRR